MICLAPETRPSMGVGMVLLYPKGRGLESKWTSSAHRGFRVQGSQRQETVYRLDGIEIWIHQETSRGMQVRAKQPGGQGPAFPQQAVSVHRHISQPSPLHLRMQGELPH